MWQTSFWGGIPSDLVCPQTFSRYGNYKGTVSRINNDGEYDVIYMCAASNGVYEADPAVVADYKASGIPDLPSGEHDWPTFASRWRARFSTKFSDALTNDPESPELKDALFSEYQVQVRGKIIGRGLAHLS